MPVLKIGITGQSGFIGTHLFNTFGLFKDKFRRIPFEDDFFKDTLKLEDFVSQCDVIVHLAALNRHNDPQVIYETNLKLVTRLISACESTKSVPHILFSSSTQEERDNLYGKSKKEGRKLLEEWAIKNNAMFTGFIIPNVYGPFGNPYYNSVVATFCHQLTHNEKPRIDIDIEIYLIYVNELINQFISHIESMQLLSDKSSAVKRIAVKPTAHIKVSSLLQKLTQFRNDYFEYGIIPCLDDTFDKHLFNTLLCYIDHASFFPFHLKLNSDNRGNFVETIKLKSGGQVSFSSTVPRITRGNHFHTRKCERFAVIKGKARIDIRKIGTEKVLSFELNGDQPSFVDMPVWFTHNITNIGDDELYTIFWINEHFDSNDSDTFYENVT